MRHHRSTLPEFITARYPGTCPETGKTWQKGDKIAWFPDSRKAYHESSKAAEQIRCRQFAQAWGMTDADY